MVSRKDVIMQFAKFMSGKSNDLSSIKKEDCVKAIELLIEDENEAVSGYDKSILLFNNGDREDKDKIIAELQKIRADEIEHIEMLKKLL